MDEKGPLMTDTAVGKQIVELFAYGCIQYMQDHSFPISEEGFEQLTVHSRDTGLNGRIAFQVYEWTQNRLQTIFAQTTGMPVNATPEAARKLRPKKSLRNRLLSYGLGLEDSSTTAEEKGEILNRLREIVGDQMSSILKILILGDCQRDLVWQKIVEIRNTGSVAELLEQYKNNP